MKVTLDAMVRDKPPEVAVQGVPEVVSELGMDANHAITKKSSGLSRLVTTKKRKGFEEEYG